MKPFGVFILCTLALSAMRLEAEDFLDRIDDAVTFSAWHDVLRARFSGLFDLEGYQFDRPAPGLIHHSDRGIQYAAEAYRQALAASGITPSMSRKGDCWDNAPMESFFHTLKTERVHHRVYADRDHARRDLFGYIEGFYNPRRLHSALGYICPAEAERRAA